MYNKNVNSVAAANSSGAVETGDHSKNGASPKSLMSKGNFLTSEKGVDFKLFIMKKFLLVSAVIIGFGVSLNAQDFCDETGNRIEFYPKADSDGKVSFFNGGDVPVEVEGNFLVGRYKTKKSSSTAYLMIEFYDKGKSTPAFFGKYYRGTTSREGVVLTNAYIEIL